MKGDPKVLKLLNEALKNELTATNQYWLHYRLLDNMGVHKLAQFERAELIDEMKHADRLAERILFLDGLPNFQALGRLHIGENVEEILRGDLELEMEALTQLRGAIAHCEKVRDYASRDLFSEILDQRGGACRPSRAAVRADHSDGPAQLHPAAVGAGGRLSPLLPIAQQRGGDHAAQTAWWRGRHGERHRQSL